MNLIVLISLGLGVMLTWLFEGLGGYIKEYGARINRQTTSAMLVQSIGVFSRIGFFLQAFAVAWVLDTKSFQDGRFTLVLFCEFMALASLFILFAFGDRLSKSLFLLYSRVGIIKPISKMFFPQRILIAKKPNFIQVLGYLFLYLGAFSPLYIQMLFPEFAARSIALSGIINGISTLILISYMDVKYADQIESKGLSLMQGELLGARFAALIILIVFQVTILLATKN
jgi:hypothetical protein